MKKYHVQNYVRWKEDMAAAIKRLPNKPYNKLLYLKKRYIKLYEECIKRGFNVQNYINAWNNIPEELMNDYKVKVNDIRIIRQRINEKLNK